MTHAQIPSQLKEPKPVRETGSETTLFLSSCHVTPFAGGWPRTWTEVALLLQEAVRQEVTRRPQWLDNIPHTVQGPARPAAATLQYTREHSRLFWKPRVLYWEVETSNGCLTRGAVRELAACWRGNRPLNTRVRHTLPPAPSTGRPGPGLWAASSHHSANRAVLQKMWSDDLLPQLPCDG